LLILFVSIPVTTTYRSTSTKDQLNSDIKTLSLAISNYYGEYSQLPDSSNQDLVNILQGNNPRKLVFLHSYKIKDGKYFDPWATPYKIIINSISNFFLTSAGKDKQFNTSDDISYKL